MSAHSPPVSTGTDEQVLSRIWKSSAFVWTDGLVAKNDLTAAEYTLTSDEAEILAELSATTPSAVPARKQAQADDRAVSMRRLADHGLLVPTEEDEGRKFSVKRV